MKKLSIIGGVLLLSLSSITWAENSSMAKSMGLYVYPAQEQSATQQETDDIQCYNWAKDQSGIDPMGPAVEAAPVDQGADGARLRGAAKGAAAGAIIGDSSDSAKSGAAVGVLAGGGASRRGKKQAEANAVAQADAANAANHDAFNRAFGSCLSGRGYTVN
ncbi:MAG: hypothetical protein V7711_10320 [Pseudomonadales bacterium]